MSGNLGHEEGEPTHHRAQSHTYTLTFTQYGQFRDANQPTTHDFRLGRKPKYPEETPKAWEEHVNTIHNG
ncbi:hypothetical protein QTP86_026208 [Hemibagrus guttatus]|nr:hypothetical protein QTP86_026208 [Hemibagrus guttatus]